MATFQRIEELRSIVDEVWPTSYDCYWRGRIGLIVKHMQRILVEMMRQFYSSTTELPRRKSNHENIQNREV